ncbi:hypothetical protein [Nocardia crassostreae]|uniref:hypothetical protein n=1 Tax=Nocardia crassostreae TaxID=53428 RepID=UPI000A75A7DB|nr:hypothetical protein [Nocardia crassostreae]
MRAKYFWLILTPLVLVTSVLLWLVAVHEGSHREWQRLTLCAAAIFCNIFVLGYHATTPPHPKFLLLRRRRIAIRVHAISGGLEIVTGVVAYFTVQFTPVAGVAMALIALLFHVPTSVYQASIVFGAKAVMTPVYAFVIFVHAFCAVHLLLNPSSQFWVVSTFLALNAYVWCRVLIWLFLRYRLFPESTYSVAITMAAMISVSSTIGFTGNLLRLGFVFSYAQLYQLIMKPSAKALAAHSSEHGRESLIDDHVREAWEAMEFADVDAAESSNADRARARVLFGAIDADANGMLSPRELYALIEGKLPWQAVQAFVDRHGRHGHITFDEFFTEMQPIWKFGFHVMSKKKLALPV